MCDCILRDSASYLDHINGKYHNRALGMSMRVEKSTVDDVRTRLEKLKEGREQRPEMDSVADGVQLSKCLRGCGLAYDRLFRVSCLGRANCWD